MAESAPKKFWSESEYLAFEEASKDRHEYYQGEIFAMSGGSFNHSRIIARLLRDLGALLEGGHCEPSSNDLRIKVEGTGLYTYPDITIVCGEPELQVHPGETLLNPAFIVEVLSPSTEKYDRTIKFDHYARIPSLNGYLLVSQDAPRMELVSKEPSGSWTLTVARGLTAKLEIPCLGIELDLARIYKGINFPASTMPGEP